MFSVRRSACCVALVVVLAACDTHRGGWAEQELLRPSAGSGPPGGAATAPAGPASDTSSPETASAEDREPLGDFCGWYNDDLPQSMDTVSGFLGAFGISGGDYADPQVEGSAQGAEQAAGETANALNDFLSGFPDGLSEAARRAVLGLRDAMAELASAIRDESGAEQINAEVSVFNDAYKALRPACGE